MITDNIAMLETRLSIVDRVCSETPILLVTLKTPNQLQGESYVFRKLNICSHKLDVQKANINVSQFTGSEIISSDVSLLLICGIW